MHDFTRTGLRGKVVRFFVFAVIFSILSTLMLWKQYSLRRLDSFFTDDCNIQQEKREEALARSVRHDMRNVIRRIYEESPEKLIDNDSAKLLTDLHSQPSTKPSGSKADLEEMKKAIRNFKEKSRYKLSSLQSIVLNRILKLQNPENCRDARKLVCKVTSWCGLGCTLHHFSVCLFISLGTNRTLLLDYSQSPYKNMAEVFEPLSLTCKKTDFDEHTLIEWKGELSSCPTSPDVVGITLNINGGYTRKTLFTPYTVPEGLLEPLKRYHADPHVWWIGQVVKHLTRVQPWVDHEVMRVKTRLKFGHPIVGVHIRRSDKILTEAAFHNLSQYMNHVEQFYTRYEKQHNRKVTKKVYLASDDLDVVTEARECYTDYQFLLSSHATSLNSRYTDDGLLSTIIDVLLLKECDYFVGTFSSNIARLVYELMQADGEKTFDVVSIDTYYHSFPMYDRWLEAIEDHTPTSQHEIELRIGDRIQYSGYLPIMIYGTNKRTLQQGWFPTSKVREVLIPAAYPGLNAM